MVLDALSEIVFEIDPDMRFRFLSAAWDRVIGFPSERVIGRKVSDIAVGASLPLIEEELGRLFAGDADQVAFEIPALVSGSPGWLDIRCSARRDADGVLTSIAGMMTDVTNRRRNEERLAHLALHDPLTGLPNRSLLSDRLSRAMTRNRRDRHTVGVLFIDLDHFKVVNDSLGHDAGDELLTTVAERLSAAMGESEVVARVGSDEFVIVAEDLDDHDGALALAARIQEVLHEPVRVAGIEHRVDASIGVVSVAPGKLRPVNDLLAEADLAMHQAKQRGRNRVEVFERGLRARASDRMETEAALRRALAQDELEVFYQPVISLETGAVQGAEALVRWRDPVRGLVPPGLFIPTAEECGLIAPMTSFVLVQALRDFAELDGLTVAVNVSARQLIDASFPGEVARALRESGIAAQRVTLELTETAVLADPASSLAILHQLRDLGLTLALDDFGTGYSALSHLQQLPVGCVKIDRSFVDGINASPTNRALVEAVAGLATALDLRLVAEGVETEEQASVLRTIRCPSAQGYLYARPMPLDEFLQFVHPGQLHVDAAA